MLWVTWRTANGVGPLGRTAPGDHTRVEEAGGQADAHILDLEAVFFLVLEVQRLTQRFGPRHLIEIVGSLLCLRHLDGKPLLPESVSGAPASTDEVWGALLHRAERMDPEDEFVLRELRAADSSAVVLARLAEDLIEAAYTARGAFEWLLASRTHLGLMADALALEFRQLLVQLADLPPRIEQRGHITVADPHARDGDLLAALVRAVDGSCPDGCLGGGT
jgi:hypothetical protein